MAQPGKDDALLLLQGWFDRDLGRYARWDRDVELVEQLRDGTVRIKIYTDTHCYLISASPGIREPQKPLLDGERRSYLGCTAHTRKPRAGEDWSRGNDLHDGPLTEETWIGVLGDILSYEMVRIHKDTGMSVRPRGGNIVDRLSVETPSMHGTDRAAGGTAAVDPPGMEPKATAESHGLEPDNSFRSRLLAVADPADRDAIGVATPAILDLIGVKYGRHRFGSFAPTHVALVPEGQGAAGGCYQVGGYKQPWPEFGGRGQRQRVIFTNKCA